jgi:hypothetical protein
VWRLCGDRAKSNSPADDGVDNAPPWRPRATSAGQKGPKCFAAPNTRLVRACHQNCVRICTRDTAERLEAEEAPQGSTQRARPSTEARAVAGDCLRWQRRVDAERFAGLGHLLTEVRQPGPTCRTSAKPPDKAAATPGARGGRGPGRLPGPPARLMNRRDQGSRRAGRSCSRTRRAWMSVLRGRSSAARSDTRAGYCSQSVWRSTSGWLRTAASTRTGAPDSTARLSASLGRASTSTALPGPRPPPRHRRRLRPGG